MTIDDDNSVYVGGLPYNATEESLRRVFDLYGQVIAVKIINDRGVGGKCYGFVTFTNPRSAVDAINDMDGRTVEGRVVKVNEVRTRGGRSNFGRDTFRHNHDRGTDLDRGRGRERDHDFDRERSRDRTRERSQDRDQVQARRYDHPRDRFIARDSGPSRDRELENAEHDHDRNDELEWREELNSDPDEGKEIRRTNNHRKTGKKDKDQPSKLLNGSDFSDGHSRWNPSESNRGDYYQVEKHLEISNENLQNLQKEISHMEVLVEERRGFISELGEKSKRLEDALAGAKKLTAHREKQLAKLLKFYLVTKDYGQRLGNSEHELQSLVDSTLAEVEFVNDADMAGRMATVED